MVNLGVLAFQINISLQKLVILCATRAEVNLGVLGFKISILRQELVISATNAGLNLDVLTLKIRHSATVISNYLWHSCWGNFGRFRI